MDRRFLSILAGVIVIFAGIAIFSGGGDNNQTNSSAQPTNHVIGQGAKDVTLTEYIDYQCPVCKAYYPVIKDVAAKYDKDIRIRFANLPIVAAHPNAFSAARAAEAADLQGKYMEMYDQLFQNQSAWSTSGNPLNLFNQYAQAIGLNVDKFKKDYASSTVNDRINADVAEFNKTKQLTATPTFFLNGKFIDNKDLIDSETGIPSVDKFSQKIDAEIAQKSTQ